LPSSLVLGTDENFYGTTFYGGTGTSCNQGCGTIFRITRQGLLTTLYSFSGSDGANPGAALVEANDGNFYGTTFAGGAHGSCVDSILVGCGTTFKMSPAGIVTTLHSFDQTDGANPFGALIQGTDGNLYGTTSGGGAHSYCKNDGSGGCGTVFKMTPRGTLTTLHNFDGNDGSTPLGGLLEATDGNFYGTTFDGALTSYCSLGAANGTCGTIFKITSEGVLTTLHRFANLDGGNSNAPLVQTTDGNFYGSAEYGGAAEYYGTLFKLRSSGSFSGQHTFSSGDGANPVAALFQATNGTLYGTIVNGGTGNYGTVFSLGVGLGPFVTTLPISRKIGQRIAILGNNLVGTTSLMFNGTAATFTVVSSTEILTTVPSGATTGPVQVVTPSGTLTSNVNFQVLP
jgi:uncharacterized repeat protein (TIGR03803 family)